MNLRSIGLMLLAAASLVVGASTARAQGPAPVEVSQTIVYIDGAKYRVHAVQAGQTLYGLSKAYGVSEQALIENNPELAQGPKVGQTIRVPFVTDRTEVRPENERRLRKTYDFHNVAAGETLYAIARRYEIPVATLMTDNPELDPLHLQPGQRILIRRKQIGSESEAATQSQWEQYRQSLNSVADEGTAYHIVRPGETFYSLARRFGITEQQLSALNNGLQPADLKAGAMIKVTDRENAATEAGSGTVGADFADNGGVPAPGIGNDHGIGIGIDFGHNVADSVADFGPEIVRSGREFEFRALRSSQPLRIALLLPLSTGERPNTNYLEFYQGFLMGLDSVKTRDGHSVQVDLFNTARDPQRMAQIVGDAAFRQAQLIVGPVYEEEMAPAVAFAEQAGVPMVSPLANVERLGSDALFQLAPDPARKYDKVKELIGEGRRVTIIDTDSVDREFEAEMLALLDGVDVARFAYKYVHPSATSPNNNSGDLTPLLENDGQHLFIILSNDEVEVDRILAALASAENGLSSRGRTVADFRVLGNSRWNRYNIDRELFFKNRVTFVSSYHAKRDAEVVKRFDSAYIRAFGALPSLYSYRGYDTAVIFARAMFGDIEYDLEQKRYTPLQTTYLFERSPRSGNHVNVSWMRVNYQKDFTISVE